MKKKIGIVLMLTMMVAFGCKDSLLDVKNENTYTDESYFKTQAQFNESVLATYTVFSHMGMMSREWYFIFDLLANDAERKSALEGNELELADYSFNNNNELLEALWSSLYRMIFRANLSLKVVGNWEPTNENDQALKTQYIAEAHWLRGFAYFNLVSNWGRVPLKLTYEDSQVNSTPRSSVEDVWKLVENEFTLASADLPVVYPSSQKGRATKGAAIAFLGRAYLFQEKFDLAKAELGKLENGAFPYSLDERYDHLFGEDNINSPEVIFSVNHVYTTSNTQYYMFGGWEGSDGKTFHTGRAQEYGFNDWGNVGLPDALVDAFSYPNPQSGATYIDPRAALNFYGNASNGGDTQYCDSCPSGVIDYPFDASGNTWRKYQEYEWKKASSAPMSQINTHVIRYADVLLMLAESHIEVGDVAIGIGYINQVRNRPSVKAVNYPTTLSQLEARHALRLERRMELAGEQSRWFDLIRWGIAKEVLTMERPAGPGQHPFLDKFTLFPIPLRERSSNAEINTDVANEWN